MWKYKDKLIAIVLSLVISILVLYISAVFFDVDVFIHSPYDSYTRQALAWREGRTYLNDPPETIQYLELAIYEGKYYVSFPPVPSVVEYVLTFFFGQNTPNKFMLYIYTVVSSIALTLMFERKHAPATSLCFGLMASLGTNLLSIITFGGVWHEAQALAFMLCSLATYFIDSENKFLNGLSLFLSALAVGCRPFTVIFIPFLLWRLYERNKKGPIYKLINYLIAPAFVAIALMWYNYIRFDNVFEFGHNYLPEFVREENGQFHLSYLLPNLIQSIKLPFEFTPEFKFVLDKFNANIFYVFNTVILVYFIYAFNNFFVKRKLMDYLFFLAVVLFVLATCMHKTLGGMQFGARYYIDMIPYIAFYLSSQKLNLKYVNWIACIFSVAINIYGIYFIVNFSNITF